MAEDLQGLVDALLLRLDTMENTVEKISVDTADMVSKWQKKKEELSSPPTQIGEDFGFTKKPLHEISQNKEVLSQQAAQKEAAVRLQEEEAKKKAKVLPPVPPKPSKRGILEGDDHSAPRSTPGVTVRGGASIRGVTVRGGVSARGVSVRGGLGRGAQ